MKIPATFFFEGNAEESAVKQKLIGMVEPVPVRTVSRMSFAPCACESCEARSQGCRKGIQNDASATLLLCSGFLGRGNLILRVHGKEFEIAEGVSSVEAAA
jgi:hypothetical protein